VSNLFRDLLQILIFLQRFLEGEKGKRSGENEKMETSEKFRQILIHYLFHVFCVVHHVFISLSLSTSDTNLHPLKHESKRNLQYLPTLLANFCLE